MFKGVLPCSHVSRVAAWWIRPAAWVNVHSGLFKVLLANT